MELIGFLQRITLVGKLLDGVFRLGMLMEPEGMDLQAEWLYTQELIGP